MNSPIFNPFVKTLADGQDALPAASNCVLIQSVSGTIYASFEDGAWFLLRSVYKFKADVGQVFNSVRFKGTGAVNAVFGFGDIQTSSSGGAAVNQIFYGAFDDPNGNVLPDDLNDAAIYYKDQSSPVIQWAWSVANQNWFEVLGA